MTARPSGEGIDAVDAKLNVFALANGMDLRRLGEARVLEWFRDGLDRRVRLEPGPGGDGTWALRAAASGREPTSEALVTLESALAAGEILSRFQELLAGALDAANAIRREDLPQRP